MSITLGSNIASLRGQRQLAKTSAELGTVFERLSSGLRINRASDDAAGLAISQSLRADSAIVGQGQRNVNDALSLLSIAEGSLSQLNIILTRTTELASQAANGVYSSEQRNALDAEAQALYHEYTRITDSSEFNGRKLLDGTLGELHVQAGKNVISFELGSFLPTNAVGGRTFEASTTVQTTGAFVRDTIGADVNNDGFDDVVTVALEGLQVSLGNGDGTFKVQMDFGSLDTPHKVDTQDINGDGNLDVLVLQGPGGSGNSVAVLLGNGDGTFKARSNYTVNTSDAAHDFELGDLNKDGNVDIAVTKGLDDSIGILLGNSNGTFKAVVSHSAVGSTSGLAMGDVNADGNLDLLYAIEDGTRDYYVRLGNGNGTFKASALAMDSMGQTFAMDLIDINADGILDIVGHEHTGDNIQVALGNSNGTFSIRTLYAMGDHSLQAPAALEVSDFDGDGNIDILAVASADNELSIFYGNGDGTFNARYTQAEAATVRAVGVGDFDGDDVSDLLIGSESPGVVNLYLQDSVEQGGLPPISLKTRDLDL